MYTVDGGVKKWRKGTVSLSLMTYYLFKKVLEYQDKVILIMEDNTTFENNFITEFNKFKTELPNDDWQMLDIHSFRGVKEGSQRTLGDSSIRTAGDTTYFDEQTLSKCRKYYRKFVEDEIESYLNDANLEIDDLLKK